MKPANLFFIELIIVLLFFSFSAAVILGIFAAADHKQDRSDLIEKSVICAQSVAESFSVKGNLSEAMALALGTEREYGNTAQISLDDNFAASDNGRIVLHLQERSSETAAGELAYLDMSFTLNGEEIYFLTCASYIPNGGDGNE